MCCAMAVVYICTHARIFMCFLHVNGYHICAWMYVLMYDVVYMQDHVCLNHLRMQSVSHKSSKYMEDMTDIVCIPTYTTTYIYYS